MRRIWIIWKILLVWSWQGSLSLGVDREAWQGDASALSNFVRQRYVRTKIALFHLSQATSESVDGSCREYHLMSPTRPSADGTLSLRHCTSMQDVETYQQYDSYKFSS